MLSMKGLYCRSCWAACLSRFTRPRILKILTDLDFPDSWNDTLTMRICNIELLGRRGYSHTTHTRNDRWIDALQSDDQDFFPIASKANQLIFLRWSFESVLPLQAVPINIGADGAEEVFHALPFPLTHHLPGLMNNRMPGQVLF